MATSPTLVFIPGSFGESQLYDPVLDPLRAKGYKIHALDPPAYPKNYAKGKPAPNMYDDANFVHDFLVDLADKGESIVLVGHSYGGLPVSQSTQGVTKTEREAAGKKGGVVRLGFITALVTKVGESLLDGLSGGPNTITVDEDGWMYHSLPEIAEICYNSLPPERRLVQAQELKGRHASPAFATKLTHAGYRDAPVSWFFCEDDLCVSPEVQQTNINTIEESWKGTEREGQKVDVKRVACDHIPIHSAKEEVIEWLEGLLQ